MAITDGIAKFTDLTISAVGDGFTLVGTGNGNETAGRMSSAMLRMSL
jgi:hypothetical protein